MPVSSVIIVGAGPAGLMLSILLAIAGIPSIKILERASRPSDDTRAVFYQPIAMREFQRAGIMDAVESAGFRPRKAMWRDMSGEALFELPGTGMIALTQDNLAAIVQSELQKYASAELKWSHEVLALGEDHVKGVAWVDVQTLSGLQRLEADYVVGCDGGDSTVRKLLLGPGSMAGFTWEKQLVAADITYDFPALPDIADSNLFLEPERPWLLFRPGKDETKWRVIYSEKPGLSHEELIANSPTTLQGIFPGHPPSNQYKVHRIRPYQIHQRIVDDMRKGRFILASDAAHLCCPYGAFGLNGGIADVGSLSDCLQAMHEDKAEDSILDVYSAVRKEKWKTIIDPQSQGMLRTVFSSPEDIVPNHPLYRFAKAIAADAAMAANSPSDPLALAYDFTPHINATPALA